MRFFTPLVAVLVLVYTTNAQQRGNTFSDYDYQDSFQAQAPVRPSKTFSRPPVTAGPPVQKVTPVPILKQINRHNDDGSYTYGYEGADGSFKIETKLATGEVMGKYGYVDETGKLRTVDYGANKYGFQPAGDGITVPPPTLVDESRIPKKGPNGELYYEEDDGSYNPEEQIPTKTIARIAQPQRPPQQARPVQRPAPVRDSFQYYDEPESYVAPRPRPAPRVNLGPAPPRAVIPGAAPAGPAPPRPAPAGPTYNAAPQQSYNPAPQQFASAPRPQAFRPNPVPRGGESSLLDQLANQYALPQSNSQPLHNIAFGSYSTSY